jgi:hypothetical protein
MASYLKNRHQVRVNRFKRGENAAVASGPEKPSSYDASGGMADGRFSFLTGADSAGVPVVTPCPVCSALLRKDPDCQNLLAGRT